VSEDEAAILSAAAAEGSSFAEWTRRVYVLTRAEDELVGMAQAALDLARDPATPAALRLQDAGATVH